MDAKMFLYSERQNVSSAIDTLANDSTDNNNLPCGMKYLMSLASNLFNKLVEADDEVVVV